MQCCLLLLLLLLQALEAALDKLAAMVKATPTPSQVRLQQGSDALMAA